MKMNKFQKEQIAVFRNECLSYTEIAEKLKVSRETIKSYCKRNNMGGRKIKADDNIEIIEGYCKNCGEKLIQKEKRKVRKFCSDKCREIWWNSHLNMVKRKAIYNFKCLYCGKDFTAYGNSKRKFCTHECYINYRFNGVKNNVE
jgi:endogenous inhibitor of DNA gyrase (YacG/DUF329 family)